jgi:hypothetical protein
MSARSGEARPNGPAATLQPLTGGKGVLIADPILIDLKSLGYQQREYVASGVATSYRAVGGMTRNGRWHFVPAQKAAYRTRVLVRMPSNPARFSGNVIVEWLNVSAGIDSSPEWGNNYQEITRSGDAWVGVSAQRIGVMGGPVLVKVTGVPGSDLAGKGLRTADPVRYGSLYQPGDGYSFDIYTQVGRALRSGSVFGGHRPKMLIAAGQSQSAFALVTYYDGVQPLTKAFDGFLVQSRGAVPLPLAAPGQSVNIANAISGVPAIFRTDQGAPVLDVQSETDVAGILSSYAARQPDNNRFRLWEVAGTSHVDAYLFGRGVKFVNCGVPINEGPMNLVVKAAYHDLKNWVTTDKAPVHAPRIDVRGGEHPTIVRNGYGIARGGVRTPPVEAPVATLSGEPGPNPSIICLLLGSTKPFTSQQLRRLYPSKADYLRRYDSAVAATIKAGFVLAADEKALLALADPSVIP